MTSLAHLIGLINDLRDEVETLKKSPKSPNISDLEVTGSSEDTFCLSLDISQFSHDDITVKVRNNLVTVDAHHRDREDEFGLISRQFTRKFLVPIDYDADTIQSWLTGDGKLTIKADKKAEASERFISIQQHADDAEELS